MQSPSPQHSGYHPKKAGLRTVLIVPFVLQMMLAVGLTAWLSLRNGEQAVNDVAGQLRTEVSRRVKDNVARYLALPHRLNRLHVDAFLAEQLAFTQGKSYENIFWERLQSFPEVSNSYVGLADGRFYGAREVQGERGKGFQLTLKAAGGDGDLLYYRTDENGRRGEEAQRVENYDPRQRPWYQAALEAGKAAWSEVYPDAGGKGLAITAVHPLYHGKELHAVVGAALRLEWLNDFLSDLKIGKSGQAFIMERNGLLMGTSRGDATLLIGKDGQLVRISARDSENIIVKEAALHLERTTTKPNGFNEVRQTDLDVDGEHHFLQITALRDRYGLDWFVVVVVPEADFMERIHENTRTTLLLSLIALFVALAVGILTSRWITHPLFQLNESAKRLAEGQWEQISYIKRRGDELGQLAESFYSMARQLREVFNTLEEKVRERTHDLAQKNEELENLNLELVKLNQDKNEFLGIAAHDLKNPLSAIRGLAEEIKEEYDDMEKEEVVEYAGKIHQASQKMFGLITNLLDVNAIESGKMNVETTEVNLFPVVQALVMHYSKPAQVKGITLLFEPDGNNYPAVVDENTCHQVMDNLISNAVKYSPYDKQVKVRLFKRNDCIRCEIEDQGPGLSEEDQQKLFGKFNRLSAKPTGGEHSTGLGLFIVKKLVEAMHGKVWCKSQLGNGAVFIVEFPAVGE